VVAGGAVDSQSPTSSLLLAQLVVDQADEFIAWLDADGRLLYGNPAICRALGYSLAQLQSLKVWDVSPTTPESWPTRFAEMRARPDQAFLVEMHTRKGNTVPSQTQVRYASVDGKEYLICHGHDLREPKARPEAIAHTEDRSTLESGVDAIFLLDYGAIVECHAPARPGGSREKIREDLETMLRESGTIRERIARALGGEEVTFNWYSQRSATTRVNIECTLNRIEIEGSARLIAVAVDVTARRKSARTLAQLSGRLLELQDEERRRIARELHDTTSQNLSALSMALSMMLANAGPDPRARQPIEESIALADCCVREVRTMSYLLHPPLLDELGLVSALRAFTEGYAERTGIQLELDLPAQMPRLPQAIEIALFRIVQEGLANIHRHSGSLTAVLRLKHEPRRVQLELADRGRGLPPGTLDWDMTSASRIGVGIAGMRERARQLGGRLTIASGETGTTLHVVLPVLHS
jgi:two-component system, NarL family, sensor kinase